MNFTADLKYSLSTLTAIKKKIIIDKFENTNVLAVVQSSFRSSSVVASVYASDSPADEGTRSIVMLDFSAAILSADGKYSNL